MGRKGGGGAVAPDFPVSDTYQRWIKTKLFLDYVPCIINKSWRTMVIASAFFPFNTEF